MKVEGLFEIILRTRDDTDREIEWHFPVREGDSAHATVSTDIVPAEEFQFGNDRHPVYVKGPDRVTAITLELEANLGDKRVVPKEPLMWYWLPGYVRYLENLDKKGA